MCLIRCFRMKQERKSFSWYVANITVNTTFPAPTSLQLESFSNGDPRATSRRFEYVDKLSAPDGPLDRMRPHCRGSRTRYRQFANAARGPEAFMESLAEYIRSRHP